MQHNTCIIKTGPAAGPDCVFYLITVLECTDLFFVIWLFVWVFIAVLVAKIRIYAVCRDDRKMVRSGALSNARTVHAHAILERIGWGLRLCDSCSKDGGAAFFISSSRWSSNWRTGPNTQRHLISLATTGSFAAIGSAARTTTLTHNELLKRARQYK